MPSRAGTCSIALSLAVAAATASVAAEPARTGDGIHACPDGHGGIVYQGDPCIDPPAARRAPPPATTPAPKRATGQRPAQALSPPPAPAAVPARPLIPYRGDPRWATPRSAWETFAAAMRRGDRESAIACLAPGAPDGLAARILAMGPDEMRSVAGAAAGIADEGDLGPYWSIRLLRPDGRPKWVLFERTPGGAFKIAGI